MTYRNTTLSVLVTSLYGGPDGTSYVFVFSVSMEINLMLWFSHTPHWSYPVPNPDDPYEHFVKSTLKVEYV